MTAPDSPSPITSPIAIDGHDAARDIIDRAARAMMDADDALLRLPPISDIDWEDASARPDYERNARAALSAIREGDELPGGLIVVRKRESCAA